MPRLRLVGGMALVVLGATAAGCNNGPDLVGNWSGEITCGNLDFWSEMVLGKQEAGVFVGPLTLRNERVNQNTRLELVVEYTARIRVDEEVEQELDFQVDYTSASCKGYRDDVLQTEDCAALNVDTAALEANEAALGTATWDGGHRIAIDTDACEGALVFMEPPRPL